MNIGGNLTFSSTAETKLGWAKFNVGEKFLSEKDSQLGVIDYLKIAAKTLHSDGYWEAGKNIEYIAENSEFSSISYIESNGLDGEIAKNCLMSGHSKQKYLNLNSENLTTTTGSKINICNSGVGVIKTKNLFQNEGLLDVDGNLDVITKFIGQNDGAMKVKNMLTIEASEAGKSGWNGTIESGELRIVPTFKLECNTTISTETCEIGLGKEEKSLLILNGYMEVKRGPLVGKLFNENKLEEKAYGIILNGELLAYALYAPKIGIQLKDDSKTWLSHKEIPANKKGVEFKIMTHTRHFHIEPKAVLTSSNFDEIPQRFICENDWKHEGELIESSRVCSFLCGSLHNYGVIRNEAGILNEAYFEIEEYFRNFSLLEGNILRIKGTGVLENFDRIKSPDENGLVEIKLEDISNTGSINANFIFFEYATKKEATLDGIVIATSFLIIKAPQAERFNFRCKSTESFFLLPKIIMLILNKNIHLESLIEKEMNTKEITQLIADKSISMSKSANFQDLIISNINNPSQKIEIRTESGAELQVNNMILCPNCFEVQIKLEGKTYVNNFEIESKTEKCILSGNGPEQNFSQIIMEKGCLELNSLSNFRTSQTMAQYIHFEKNINLKSLKDDPALLFAEVVKIIGQVDLGSNIIFSKIGQNLSGSWLNDGEVNLNGNSMEVATEKIEQNGVCNASGDLFLNFCVSIGF